MASRNASVRRAHRRRRARRCESGHPIPSLGPPRRSLHSLPPTPAPRRTPRHWPNSAASVSALGCRRCPQFMATRCQVLAIAATRSLHRALPTNAQCGVRRAALVNQCKDGHGYACDVARIKQRMRGSSNGSHGWSSTCFTKGRFLTIFVRGLFVKVAPGSRLARFRGTRHALGLDGARGQPAAHRRADASLAKAERDHRTEHRQRYRRRLFAAQSGVICYHRITRRYIRSRRSCGCSSASASGC